VVQEELACVSIVLAARGYPGEYRRGGVITGLDAASALANVAVFHAGTAVAVAAGTALGAGAGTVLGENVVTASGGRVLTVCATGADLASARASAYAGAAAIEWEDKMFRTDIGLRAQMRAAELLGAGLAG
jgi:phosphoribosylamine--glycine ligase